MTNPHTHKSFLLRKSLLNQGKFSYFRTNRYRKSSWNYTHWKRLKDYQQDLSQIQLLRRHSHQGKKQRNQWVLMEWEIHLNQNSEKHLVRIDLFIVAIITTIEAVSWTTMPIIITIITAITIIITGNWSMHTFRLATRNNRKWNPKWFKIISG